MMGWLFLVFPRQGGDGLAPQNEPSGHEQSGKAKDHERHESGLEVITNPRHEGLAIDSFGRAGETGEKFNPKDPSGMQANAEPERPRAQPGPAEDQPYGKKRRPLGEQEIGIAELGKDLPDHPESRARIDIGGADESFVRWLQQMDDGEKAAEKKQRWKRSHRPQKQTKQAGAEKPFLHQRHTKGREERHARQRAHRHTRLGGKPPAIDEHEPHDQQQAGTHDESHRTVLPAEAVALESNFIATHPRPAQERPEPDDGTYEHGAVEKACEVRAGALFREPAQHGRFIPMEGVDHIHKPSTSFEQPWCQHRPGDQGGEEEATEDESAVRACHG